MTLPTNTRVEARHEREAEIVTYKITSECVRGFGDDWDFLDFRCQEIITEALAAARADERRTMDRTNEADILTLEKLVTTMRNDMETMHGLNRSAVLSIAAIIEAAIGAPISMPQRQEGAEAAMNIYPGSNQLRAGFNHGVEWTLRHSKATIEISNRFGATPTDPAPPSDRQSPPAADRSDAVDPPGQSR